MSFTHAHIFIPELKEEARITRSILQLVPSDLADYKPHAKNMTMVRLATHLAEIVGWVDFTINSNELDFAKSEFKPRSLSNNQELLQEFDKNLTQALQILEKTDDAKMAEMWTMRSGETIYFTLPKSTILRTWVFNHSVHHRSWLALYLRLNNIALPSIYGPTADMS